MAKLQGVARDQEDLHPNDLEDFEGDEAIEFDDSDEDYNPDEGEEGSEDGEY